MFGRRMNEAKLRSVQGLAVKIEVVQYFAVRLCSAAINRIAKQWMADRRHVDSHLVGPPGFESAFDQRRVAQHGESPPMGHCALAAAGLDDRNFLPVRRRAR